MVKKRVSVGVSGNFRTRFSDWIKTKVRIATVTRNSIMHDLPPRISRPTSHA